MVITNNTKVKQMKYRKTTTKDLEILRTHKTAEAAKILGVKTQQVSRMRACYGVYFKHCEPAATQEQINEIQALVDSGMGGAAIARKLGRKDQTIYAIIRRYKMRKEKKLKMVTTKDLEVLRNHGNIEAAKILGKSYSAIASMRNYHKIPCPTKRGQRDNKAKLFAEDVELFIKLRAGGMSFKTIAHATSNPESTVRHAIRRVTERGMSVYKRKAELA